MDKRVVRVYALCILLTLVVGAFSGYVSNMEGYNVAIKPELTPPAWVFPVVWNVLYVLMGISAARIVLSDSTQKKPAIYVYLLQLFVNFMWSIIFFNMQAYAFSFVWLCLLWVLIVAMIRMFYPIDKLAAYLQIPYLLWVTFAGYLNYMIWQLNA